ncbi:hypothetical protein [Streptomyces sp. HNM0574]|uniref:hypothetical protein n=1 Tax=Streptomyces sp. HNM0574 TaxID=2714954 RepID=UPI00146D0098|nr:hypothetical protein [Streptomyces sp. HNM0574]NLU68197.1 hypothetical protein [Streptomyces sp. HNM0574]
MDKLIAKLAQDDVWAKWVAANSAAGDAKTGCISVAKQGCISAAPAAGKAGCIS